MHDVEELGRLELASLACHECFHKAVCLDKNICVVEEQSEAYLPCYCSAWQPIALLLPLLLAGDIILPGSACSNQGLRYL